MGEELSESEMGTGTTVVPEEPVMVLEVSSRLEELVTGTATTELPSDPEIVLEVMVAGAVPVDGAIVLLPVSVAEATVVLLDSVSVSDAAMLDEAGPVVDAEEALPVKWLESSESTDDAALLRMLEKLAERDSETALSVAVAATLEKSELRDEAKLDRAADASLVADAVPVAVELWPTSERTEDSAEAAALEKSEAADETIPGTPVADTADEVDAPVESSESVGSGIGITPPVPRSPEEDSVVFAVGAGALSVVSDPRMPVTTEPSKPPSLVVDSGVVFALAETTDELGRSLVLLPDSPDSAAVEDKGMGAEAFSALVVASLKEAEEVVEAVPSMTVERPTVIAPREDEESMALELLSAEDGPVGAGSVKGWAKPSEPTCDEAPVGTGLIGRSAERVVSMTVEPEVGVRGLSGTRPPVEPAKGTTVSLSTAGELEFSSEAVLETVGRTGLLGTWPVVPTSWLVVERLGPVGCWTLLGAEPVGAAKPPTLGDELPGVGDTIVSGTPPVEPPSSGLVRRALLKVGCTALSGTPPVEPT